MNFDWESLKGAAERKLWEMQHDDPHSLKPLVISESDSDCGGSWGMDLTIRGGLLRQILLGYGPSSSPSIVRLEGARISEELSLEAATLVCPLDLVNCYFDAAVNFEQTSAPAIYLIACKIPRGVSADQLHTDHNFDLSKSTIRNGLELRAARISGQLLMDDAYVYPDEDGRVLKCRGMTIAKGASFDNLYAEGVADISGGSFGQKLRMEGARFTNPTNGVSLRAHRITVEGSINLNRNFLAEGMVDLAGSRAKGNLGFSGGHFHKGGGLIPEEKALNLARVTVDQDAYLDSGFTALGTVFMPDVRVQGSLHCEGGLFDNEADTAIYAAGIVVSRDVLFAKRNADPDGDRSGFFARGKIVLVGARITGKLSFCGGTFYSPHRVALDAAGMKVGSLVFDEHFRAEGQINLSRVRISGLLDAGRSLAPNQVHIEGLSYTAIDDAMELGERLKWLQEMPKANIPQIYRQLASVKRAEGLDGEAKDVLMAGQDAHFRTKGAPIRALGWFFRWTVGYGYEPLLILAWLALFECVGGILFSFLRSDMLLAPIYISAIDGKHGTVTGASTLTIHGYPAFQPWLYTLDLLLPVVRLRQSDIWIPHQAAEWCAVFFVITGWALATSLVVGFGSIFARARQGSLTS